MKIQLVKCQGKIEVRFGEIRLGLDRRREMIPGDRPMAHIVVGDSFRVVLGGCGIAAWRRGQWQTRRRASTLEDCEAKGDGKSHEIHSVRLHAGRYSLQLSKSFEYRSCAQDVSKTCIEVELERAGNQDVFYRLFRSS